MGQKKLVTKTDTPTETRLGTGPSPGNEGAAQAPASSAGSVSVAKKTSKKQVINGVANISVSYNNTKIVIADTKGEVLAWSSSGSLGFKGSKKSTPYAAGLVAKNVVEKARRFNLVNLKIVVKGIGPGRESAIRGLAATGINITGLMDRTPVAHNGVRPKKPRRV